MSGQILNGLIQKARLDANAQPFRIRPVGHRWEVYLPGDAEFGESISGTYLREEQAESALLDKLTTE